MKIEAVEKALDFIRRQEKPFKVNLVRASFQNFLILLTQQSAPIHCRSRSKSPAIGPCK
jgi:hypothetical protein